jgi:hypothetical protein
MQTRYPMQTEIPHVSGDIPCKRGYPMTTGLPHDDRPMQAGSPHASERGAHANGNKPCQSRGEEKNDGAKGDRAGGDGGVLFLEELARSGRSALGRASEPGMEMSRDALAALMADLRAGLWDRWEEAKRV